MNSCVNSGWMFRVTGSRPDILDIIFPRCLIALLWLLKRSEEGLRISQDASVRASSSPASALAAASVMFELGPVDLSLSVNLGSSLLISILKIIRSIISSEGEVLLNTSCPAVQLDDHWLAQILEISSCTPSEIVIYMQPFWSLCGALKSRM